MTAARVRGIALSAAKNGEKSRKSDMSADVKKACPSYLVKLWDAVRCAGENLFLHLHAKCTVRTAPKKHGKKQIAGRGWSGITGTTRTRGGKRKVQDRKRGERAAVVKKRID